MVWLTRVAVVPSRVHIGKPSSSVSRQISESYRWATDVSHTAGKDSSFCFLCSLWNVGEDRERRTVGVRSGTSTIRDCTGCSCQPILGCAAKGQKQRLVCHKAWPFPCFYSISFRDR